MVFLKMKIHRRLQKTKELQAAINFVFRCNRSERMSNNPNDSAQRFAQQAAQRLRLIDENIGDDIDVMAVGTRALLQRARDGTLTAVDRRALNLVNINFLRRDPAANPDVGTDTLGQTLCHPISCRLQGLVLQAVEIGSNEIVYLDDELGRIGFKSRQNFTDAAAVLHLPQLTSAEVNNRQSYHLKFKHCLERAWNAETKEKVKVEKNVDGFAFVVSHTDLGRLGYSLNLSGRSLTALRKNKAVFRSSMNDSQLARLHTWYLQNPNP